VVRSYQPRDRDGLVECHAHFIPDSRDEGFDDSFAPLVATLLDEFMSDHDPSCERSWIAERGRERLGSIICVAENAKTAKLRLFLLVPKVRGLGLGKHLLCTCMEFARSVGYMRVVLWTHESHWAACGLCRANGWRLLGSKPVRSFGVDLVEQSWDFRF